jgi:hypothetical protein
LRSEQVKTVQGRRFALLQKVYERDRGDLRIWHDTEGLRCELGLDDRQMKGLVNYLVEKGLLVEGTRGAPVYHGSAIRLTLEGVDEVEKTLAPEDKTALNGNFIVAGSISNSPIQQGTTKSTQTVSFAPDLRDKLRAALARLKAELPAAGLGTIPFK